MGEEEQEGPLVCETLPVCIYLDDPIQRGEGKGVTVEVKVP